MKLFWTGFLGSIVAIRELWLETGLPLSWPASCCSCSTAPSRNETVLGYGSSVSAELVSSLDAISRASGSACNLLGCNIFH